MSWCFIHVKHCRLMEQAIKLVSVLFRLLRLEIITASCCTQQLLSVVFSKFDRKFRKFRRPSAIFCLILRIFEIIAENFEIFEKNCTFLVIKRNNDLSLSRPSKIRNFRKFRPKFSIFQSLVKCHFFLIKFAKSVIPSEIRNFEMKWLKHLQQYCL